jgi:hypothetical protein
VNTNDKGTPYCANDESGSFHYSYSMTSSQANSLTPEQRVDKNGRIVTRHVRSVVNNSTKNIPQPSLVTRTTTGKALKPTAKQLEQMFYALDFSVYLPDIEVLRILDIDTSDYARFSANNVEFCDVLSVTSPDNAVTLMSRGIKTSDDARTFLKEQGLGHLIKDMAWESDSLLKRKINPLAYAEICAKDRSSHSSPRWIVDAAEAQSIKALRDWQRNPSVPIRVLDGAIRFDDIKAIGATRLVRADPQGTAMIHALVRINKGEVDFNAHDIRLLVDRFLSDPALVNNNSAERVLGLAEEFGVDFTMSLHDPEAAYQLSSHLRYRKGASKRRGDANNDDSGEIIAYGDALRLHYAEKSSSPAGYEKIIELHEAGVDPKVAANGLQSGHEVSQIIAIHKEGIAPSVSGGWL